MWITTVIHHGGLSSGGPDWTCQPAPGGKDSCCSPVFPGTRPTRRQREAPNVTYSCSQTIPLQESGQTQTGSGPTKVGGREDGAVSPKATERIPGQLLVSEDLPLSPILQTRMRNLARSFVLVHLQGVAEYGSGIWFSRGNGRSLMSCWKEGRQFEE